MALKQLDSICVCYFLIVFISKHSKNYLNCKHLSPLFTEYYNNAQNNSRIRQDRHNVLVLKLLPIISCVSVGPLHYALQYRKLNGRKRLFKSF